jgi:FixJ family two-component response regulator
MCIPRAMIVTPDNDLRRTVQDALPASLIRAEHFATAEDCLADDCWKEAALLLADLDLPGMSGIALLERALKRVVRLPTVMFFEDSKASDIIRAYDLGSIRVLAKPVSGDMLRDIVLGAILQFQTGPGNDLRSEEAFESLSTREREVLHLLLADYSTRQIARVLLISPSTVEKHRAKILSKMQVQSVVGLVVRYFQTQHIGRARPHFTPLPSTLSQS